jgi:Protein of unknown function (DUF3592)
MWPALFGSTVIAALGVLLWTKAWRHWCQRAAMRRWSTAPAVIRGYRTRVSPSRSRSRAIDVEVSYRHAGRDYTVWCVSPTGSRYGSGSGQAERQEAAAFPVGSTHPVYVNPAHADEAFLILPEAHMLATLVSAGAILVAVAAAVVLPVTTTLPQETITLAFMALLGVVLSVLVIFLGVALIKTPRPRRRR